MKTPSFPLGEKAWMKAAMMVTKHPTAMPTLRPQRSACDGGYQHTHSLSWFSWLHLGKELEADKDVGTYQGTTNEEAADDGTYGVARVDQADSVAVPLL